MLLSIASWVQGTPSCASNVWISPFDNVPFVDLMFGKAFIDRGEKKRPEHDVRRGKHSVQRMSELYTKVFHEYDVV